MCSAARSSCGDKIVNAPRQIPEQNIVFHETHRILLVDEAAGRVACIDGVAALIGHCALFAAVAAGHVDIALFGIGGRSGLVALLAVASRAGIDDDRCSCSCIDLSVCARDRRLIVDDQSACRRSARRVLSPVSVCVHAFDISRRHAYRDALFVLDLRIGDSGHDRECPRRAAVIKAPLCPHICQVQRILNGSHLRCLCSCRCRRRRCPGRIRARLISGLLRIIRFRFRLSFCGSTCSIRARSSCRCRLAGAKAQAKCPGQHQRHVSAFHHKSVLLITWSFDPSKNSRSITLWQ